MTKKPSKALSNLAPVIVLLALLGAFFLGSRFPYFPRPNIEAPPVTREIPPPLIYGQIEVWISRDGLFVWNREKPAALDQLPGKIADDKAKHRLGRAAVSSEKLTRFDQIVYAIAELKKGGFSSVTIRTLPRQTSDEPLW